MNESKITLVTAYSGPDLDGYASVYGYAEYLKSKGQNVVPVIFGKYQPEVDFVLSKFAIDPIPEYKGDVDRPLIIVDASDIQGLYQSLKPENVTEIIDHRLHNEADSFPNAATQIEFVGSAATLIAEKFIVNSTDISHSAAALLYSAIISNTLNFQARVTTERDRSAAAWLNNILQLNQNYAWEMFENKTHEILKDLRQAMIGESAAFEFNNLALVITQLEAIGAEKLLGEREDEIKEILGEIKKDKHAELIFLTISDLKNRYNLFYSPDSKMRMALSGVLSINFEGDLARREGLIMRKEIVPLLKEYFNDHP